jgi:hypothetical protein
MSISLTHLGASVRGLAYAMAQGGRVNGQQVLATAAADRMAAGALMRVQPVSGAAEAREQVMAERGIDRVTLLSLGPQGRLQAEASIEAAAAGRARQARLLDIRI